MIIAAYAYRPKKHGTFGTLLNILRDTLPQKQKRCVMLLVLGADEGAAEFEGWSKAFEETGLVLEQCACI
jgi:hypothetical protein